MKFMERMKRKKLGNKGFSLVELVIVIAIMAVLIGIVGTQVVPHLNKAREAKDMQIINSYCTAAVTAYASNAERFAAIEHGMSYRAIFIGKVFDDVSTMNDSMPTYYWIRDIINLTGYSSIEHLQKTMTSVKGRTIEDVEIGINFQNGTITVQAIDGDGSPILEKVTGYIGVTPASEEDDDDD